MNYKKILTLVSPLLSCIFLASQGLTVGDPYLLISADGTDPVYTTYTAAMERSQLYGDKGYKMDHYSMDEPLHYFSDKGGRIFTLWEVNDVVVDKMADLHSRPVAKASFSDMVLLEYELWPGIEVAETFMVYSSDLAVVDITLKNTSSHKHTIDLYPCLAGADSMEVTGYNGDLRGYTARHYETRERLISDLYRNAPYPEHLTDYLVLSESPFSFGAYETGIRGLYDTIKTDFYADDRSDSLNLRVSGKADVILLHARFDLAPGESRHVRYLRGCTGRENDPSGLEAQIGEVITMSLQPYADANVELFRSVPRIDFSDPDEKAVYLSAFNLVRGCMLPPSGETSHNFYVFSREPLWGWGHGHQVLHESLSMIAYAYLDPVSAQNSQRVYMEQQGNDGLIAYRHGPRGPQTYPHKGMPTTSAPFFSWINLEIYKVSSDREFLEDAYRSGSAYLNWLLENRDTDRDGTFEWGPYGIIENVRDWYNVIFQVSKERYLDIDKEDISDELECLDLSLMVVNEMRCLSDMAEELGLPSDAGRWDMAAGMLTELINDRMWDEETGFFYHVDKEDHSFHFMDRDLKRQEIIGFLPMWANAVSPGRAEILVKALADTNRFWRKYGVPTLSAEDPWYSPYVDYCCKWNGPVWLLWDYMVFEGLLNYGYEDLALELGEKMLDAVTVQLRKNHNFWESYSPDNEVLNCPSNYIWDAIIAKVLIRSHEVSAKR